MFGDDSLLLGKDMDTGDMIHIRADRSQRILVCGKTGTGKSYTLGVLVEELARLESSIILVVDPQGIFWTMAESNSVASEADGLWAYDRSPSGFPLNLMVPATPSSASMQRSWLPLSAAGCAFRVYA